MSDTTQLRRWIHHLIIAIAFAIACGRIISVQRVYEPAFYPDPSRWPSTKPDSNSMFGSNDRARWATIRALVHERTYVIGKREPLPIVISATTLFAAGADPMQAAILMQAGYDYRTNVANPKVHNGIIFKDGLKEHGWATIDRVMDPQTLEFHSSKPPLLSTILAGLYWILFNLTGLSLIDKPTIVVRTMLFLVNALPFAGYLWLLSQVAERWGKTDWGKIYVVAAGAFGTMVTPFLITLNNHTMATFSITAALWSVLCVWDRISLPSPPERGARAPWQHFVSAGFFSAFAATNEMPALAFTAAAFILLLWWSPMRTLLLFVPSALIPGIAFFYTNYLETGQLQPVQSQFQSRWYQYEGSHWVPPTEGYTKTGIDWARLRETKAEYAMHVFVGHHGIFSLTPIWLLAAFGMVVGSFRIPTVWRQAVFKERGDYPWFMQPLGLSISAVVIAFYLTVESRNYGGFTNGLRWLMWLTPIWLTCLIPVVDWLATRCTGRWLAGACLAFSIFAASYQLWSPWRHPWIFDLMIEMKWKGY